MGSKILAFSSSVVMRWYTAIILERLPFPLFFLQQNEMSILEKLTRANVLYRKNYYKEGDVVYPKFDAVEAYRRSLRTWGKWIDKNVNPEKQLVFYRGYSSAHFRYYTQFTHFSTWPLYVSIRTIWRLHMSIVQLYLVSFMTKRKKKRKEETRKTEDYIPEKSWDLQLIH